MHTSCPRSTHHPTPPTRRVTQREYSAKAEYSPPCPQIAKQVLDGDRLPIPAPEELPGGGGFPGLPAFLTLMQRCWDADPTRRPSFKEGVIPELK